VRVILDNNIWSYIGTRDEARAFEELEDDLGLRVVIPPSILLEILRTPDTKALTAIVRSITSRRGTRLHPLPEARLEADEFAREAERLRPHWVRPFPKPKRSDLEAFWTRRIWQSAARDPQSVVKALPEAMERTAEQVLSVQRDNKEVFVASGSNLLAGGPPLADLSGHRNADLTAGWNGNLIDSWRLDGARRWWQAISTALGRAKELGGERSLIDWLEVTLEIAMVGRDRAGYNRFWYEGVSEEMMPRNWMRSVVDWVQLESKIGSGNPRDGQHAAYLFDVGLFMTADKNFGRALERLRPWCPRPFAEVRRVPAEGSIVDALRGVLGPA